MLASSTMPMPKAGEIANDLTISSQLVELDPVDCSMIILDATVTGEMLRPRGHHIIIWRDTINHKRSV